MLADTGVATISFNVLPGWHQRQVVRDICLAHAGKGSPRQRVASARAALAQVAKAVAPMSPYGALVVSEAKRLAKMPASYILGEFLAEHNHPCRFETFAEQAQGAGLAYVCDGDLMASAPATFAPRMSAAIHALAGSSGLGVQSCLDRFTGRTFRRAVLVKSRASKTLAAPSIGRLAGLHVAAAFGLGAPPADGDGLSLEDGKGRKITIKRRSTVEAMRKLADRFPATCAVDELLAAGETKRDGLAGDLLRLILTGRLSVSSMPLEVGRADMPKPAVGKLAQLEASGRQPWATSLSHKAVMLDPAARLIVPCLDGRQDKSAIVAALLDFARAKSARAATDPRMANGALDRRGAEKLLRRTLLFLERNALLEPGK